MSKKSLLLILFNAFLSVIPLKNCFGQNFQWAKQMGGSGWDEGTAIATDRYNNVYTVGFFHGTVDFDPGTSVFNLISVGEKDAFICKLDANGNFVWAKQYGDSAAIDEKSSIGVDSLGNLYITNSFVGTVDFDPGPNSFPLTSTGWDRDIFIQKLDKNGNFIWAKQISAQTSAGPAPVHSNAIAVDANGNHYLTGYFDGTVDFDPDTSTAFTMNAPTTNCFICKLDANGNFVWAKEFESAIPGVGAVGYNIAIDSNNNVYSTGQIGGTVDFNPGPAIFNLTLSTPFQAEAFICKLNSSGDFVWAKALGSGIGYALAVDKSGNAYCGNANSSGLNFLYRFDESGRQIWANPLHGVYSIRSITFAHGNLYVFGRCCLDTADLDPGSGIYSLTGNGSFIGRYDSIGIFISAGLLSGTWMNASTLDLNNKLYVTGFFEGITDFDLSQSIFNLSAIGYDVFVLKLNLVQTVGISENNFFEDITIYPNPTEGTLFVKLGKDSDYSKIVIRNILGQEIYSNTTGNGDQVEIQINGGGGLYLMEIINQNNQRYVFSLIKK